MITPSEFACVTISDWLSQFAAFGTATPAVIIYSDGVEIPRHAIVIQATSYDATEYRVTVEVSLVLDQADCTSDEHREAAATLRNVLCPAAPRFQPGTASLTCHPDFAAFANQTAGRIFDLLSPIDTHANADGRLTYLLEAQAVVVVN